MISGDKAPAAAEAGGAETGADAVDGAGATAAEVAAAGAAAGTTSSVGADLGRPSASEADGLSHGADPAGAEGRPRSPPTGLAPAGATAAETTAAGAAADTGAGAATGTPADAGAAAATTEAPASWRSRVSTRSARASNVTSASGRTIRVSAISKVSRGFVDVFSSPATSPKTPRSRARRSTPNSGSSWISSRRVVSDTSSTTSGPATAITYMLRICSAKFATNWSMSAPVSTYSATQRKHAAASRTPIVRTMSAKSVESTAPSIRSATSMVTAPSPKAMSCSSEVSALRMPPSARCAMSSRASPSNSTFSAVQMAPKRDTMASVEMRRKSKRWHRE